MALQTNLNKKDKITIAIVLFAALVFTVIWFLIKPAITSILTTEDKIEQAEHTQTQYQSKLLYLSSAETLYSKAVNDLNESTADYYEVMDSSEIDRMVTSYVLKSGLFAESLNIKMPNGAVEENPYIYSEVTGSQTTTGTVSDTSTVGTGGVDTLLLPYSNARNNAKSTSSSGVQCAGLTIVVTGTPAACQALIDDLCTKPAVRITGFSWEKLDMIEHYNEQTGMYEYVDSGKIRLRIDLNLYMADVADYESAVSDAVNNAFTGAEV